jgi:hypothetical protein
MSLFATGSGILKGRRGPPWIFMDPNLPSTEAERSVLNGGEQARRQRAAQQA